MSNKNTNSNQQTVKSYIDLIYMTALEVRAKDIAALLPDKKDIKVEVWETADILELELSNQNTVDFEPLDIKHLSSSDSDFIRSRNIHTMFSINLCESDLQLVKMYFDQIVERFSGFLCADTEDFNPVYVGSSAK